MDPERARSHLWHVSKILLEPWNHTEIGFMKPSFFRKMSCPTQENTCICIYIYIHNFPPQTRCSLLCDGLISALYMLDLLKVEITTTEWWLEDFPNSYWHGLFQAVRFQGGGSISSFWSIGFHLERVLPSRSSVNMIQLDQKVLQLHIVPRMFEEKTPEKTKILLENCPKGVLCCFKIPIIWCRTPTSMCPKIVWSLSNSKR